ncbi:hypothetical protein GGR52DRAFT_381226 [Hypoxylon sp. FL1284]|nr:hypothetical protein GGR52DRAFT_381226 [Hypoxylon sp. FL1284]
MSEELLKACRGLEEARTPWSDEAADELVPLVPQNITVQDVKGFLSEDGKEKLGPVAALWAACAVVLKIAQDVKKGKRDIEDSALYEIADRISAAIVPVCDGASLDEDTTDYATLQLKADLGLAALASLASSASADGDGTPRLLPDAALLRVAAFTDAAADPWTSASGSAHAHTLLRPLSSRSSERRDRLVADEILTGFLRPLFARSRPAAVTAAGRKAEFVETSRYDAHVEESPETKPWKYAHRYAVTVFAWAVRQADPERLQNRWPLYTPVLLTLLDEPGPEALRVRALGLLRAFWARCPAGLMRRTGLADVFEQAVFPALLCLPTLTPDDESLEILGAAYPALIEMAGLVADLPEADLSSLETTSPDAASKQQQKQELTQAQRNLLDKIVREGILVGYHHAREHIQIVGLLCEMLVCIINGMGILAVKHLKEFIPMASDILTDPFGTKYPPALLSASKMLQAILRTCWPRMTHYCNEIINMLMLCWLNIDDEDSLPPESPIASELKSELTKTADILSAVMKAAQFDLGERVGPLIEREPQLSKLFRPKNSA